MHSGAGSLKNNEAGAADRKRGWCSGRDVFARAKPGTFAKQMCEYGPGGCTWAFGVFGIKGARGLSCSPAPADRPGPKRHEPAKAAKAGGERDCEGRTVAVLRPLSGNKAFPLRGQDAANLPRILSPRGCQRRTVGG